MPWGGDPVSSGLKGTLQFIRVELSKEFIGNDMFFEKMMEYRTSMD
jgi:hypothetical protein